MALYNTTNTIDSSMFLKAKLSTNKVGSNYYIENIQNRRNRDWDNRYNVVGIEEELNKQIEYTYDDPVYTPIECVITNVRLDTGEEMGTDWARLAFKDLTHPNGEGYRYRFSLDFPDMSTLSEDEKHYNTSIWIGVNKSPIKAGNSCIVRRCNSSMAMLGSPSLDDEYVTEVHYEPIIIESEAKYQQVYYNQTMPVPQAELYFIAQLNYFTNFIKINNRILLSTIDMDNREANSVFIVKSIEKFATEVTFVRDSEHEMINTPTILIGVDKDMISPEDNLENRIAKDAPVYLVPDITPAYQYYVDIETTGSDRILLATTEEFTVNLCYDGNIVSDSTFDFEVSLENVNKTLWSKYYTFTKTGDNTFTIYNKKACSEGKLRVKATCTNSEIAQQVSQTYEFELGSFY